MRIIKQFIKDNILLIFVIILFSLFFLDYYIVEKKAYKDPDKKDTIEQKSDWPIML